MVGRFLLFVLFIEEDEKPNNGFVADYQSIFSSSFSVFGLHIHPGARERMMPILEQEDFLSTFEKEYDSLIRLDYPIKTKDIPRLKIFPNLKEVLLAEVPSIKEVKGYPYTFRLLPGSEVPPDFPGYVDESNYFTTYPCS